MRAAVKLHTVGKLYRPLWVSVEEVFTAVMLWGGACRPRTQIPALNM